MHTLRDPGACEHVIQIAVPVFAFFSQYLEESLQSFVVLSFVLYDLLHDLLDVSVFCGLADFFRLLKHFLFFFDVGCKLLRHCLSVDVPNHSVHVCIMFKAAKILNFRVFDLFTQYLEDWCHDDPIARIVLHERLLWFVQQLREELRQQLKASEIERNTPEDSEVDAVDQYFRKCPEVFTPESYDKLSMEITLQCIEAGRKPKNEC